jgi:hypothetical protein
MSKNVLVRNSNKGAVLGYAMIIGGFYLLYDAYDKRGRSRPFLAKLLPG